MYLKLTFQTLIFLFFVFYQAKWSAAVRGQGPSESRIQNPDGKVWPDQIVSQCVPKCLSLSEEDVEQLPMVIATIAYVLLIRAWVSNKVRFICAFFCLLSRWKQANVCSLPLKTNFLSATRTRVKTKGAPIAVFWPIADLKKAWPADSNLGWYRFFFFITDWLSSVIRSVWKQTPSMSQSYFIEKHWTVPVKQYKLVLTAHEVLLSNINEKFRALLSKLLN